MPVVSEKMRGQIPGKKNPGPEGVGGGKSGPGYIWRIQEGNDVFTINYSEIHAGLSVMENTYQGIYCRACHKTVRMF
jgi:hypothetical protein